MASCDCARFNSAENKEDDSGWERERTSADTNEKAVISIGGEGSSVDKNEERLHINIKLNMGILYLITSMSNYSSC